MNVTEVVDKVKAFLRFDLRRWGLIKKVEPVKGGWRVWTEVSDPRMDLSKSYQTVYEQNLYKLELDKDLNITDFTKVGDSSMFRSPGAPAVSPPAPVLDKKMVKAIAEEVARGISVNVDGLRREDEIQIKGGFIDPAEKRVALEHNFQRLGKVSRSDEEIDSSVSLLRNIKCRKNGNTGR